MELAHCDRTIRSRGLDRTPDLCGMARPCPYHDDQTRLDKETDK